MSFQELYGLEMLSVIRPTQWERAMQIYEQLMDAGEPSERAAEIATDISQREYQPERQAA